MFSADAVGSLVLGFGFALLVAAALFLVLALSTHLEIRRGGMRWTSVARERLVRFRDVRLVNAAFLAVFGVAALIVGVLLVGGA